MLIVSLIYLYAKAAVSIVNIVAFISDSFSR